MPHRRLTLQAFLSNSSVTLSTVSRLQFRHTSVALLVHPCPNFASSSCLLIKCFVIRNIFHPTHPLPGPLPEHQALGPRSFGIQRTIYGPDRESLRRVIFGCPSTRRTGTSELVRSFCFLQCCRCCAINVFQRPRGFLAPRAWVFVAPIVGRGPVVPVQSQNVTKEGMDAILKVGRNDLAVLCCRAHWFTE